MSRAYVYGFNVIETLVREAPQRILQVFVDKSRRDARARALQSSLYALGLTCQSATTAKIDTLTGGGRHQGIAAEVLSSTVLDAKGLFEHLRGRTNPLLCVLESVQDPRNLGACLRTAEAANVDAVVLPRHDSCDITPVVRKAAAGAAELVVVARVPNLVRVLQQLQKEPGLWLVGTDGDAPESLYDVALGGPSAMVFGSEGSGLKRLTLKCCDHVVRIPMAGKVGSLNVSVAVGIGLFEAVRQRAAGRSSPPQAGGRGGEQ